MAANPIKIAILAMGGEGGGVLADWIVDLAEHNGYYAQTTSVPGVAQRTGATIYYVELYPRAEAEADGQEPVLALMPMPGDVDIVLASELMEAGRAVQRGLITPDRTTLVSSTHRVYSMTEKMAMGDGRVDGEKLIGRTRQAAKHSIFFDMAKAAEESGSVISAVLFGAVAATGTLPFSREQFEATIERGGVGVKASLKAFDLAFGRAESGGDLAITDAVVHAPPTPPKPQPRDRKVVNLIQRVEQEFPAEAQAFLIEGVRRLIDYQDPAYANLYLDRLVPVKSWPDNERRDLLCETARHLALWMSYEDTIRVADLKIRDTRFERVRNEVRAQPDQLLAVNEFMHPRLDEIAETMPAPIGRWLLKPNWANKLVGHFTQKGRIIQTTSLHGYSVLWFMSRFRHIRRSTLRFKLETERIEGWLGRIEKAAQHNPALAVEVARCQGLVKGYSDTHARGLANFQTVMAAVDRAGAHLAPATLADLRNAALADEHGNKLRDSLSRHALA